MPKMFEMLRAGAVAAADRARVQRGNPTVRVYRADADLAARTLGVGVTVVERARRRRSARRWGILSPPAHSGRRLRAGPMFLTERVRVVSSPRAAASPRSYNQREFVAIGGLMSSAPTFAQRTAPRRGVFADRILRSPRTGQPAVEQPTKFTLALNVPAARAGLAIPQALLLARTR